jgi:hypothetical protein
LAIRRAAAPLDGGRLARDGNAGIGGLGGRRRTTEARERFEPALRPAGHGIGIGCARGALQFLGE